MRHAKILLLAVSAWARRARAAGASDLFEPKDEWRALARQILHKNDLPAPAIGDLRKLTRMAGGRADRCSASTRVGERP